MKYNRIVKCNKGNLRYAGVPICNKELSISVHSHRGRLAESGSIRAWYQFVPQRQHELSTPSKRRKLENL